MQLRIIGENTEACQAKLRQEGFRLTQVAFDGVAARTFAAADEGAQFKRNSKASQRNPGKASRVLNMRKIIQSACIVLLGYSGPTLADPGAPTFNECPRAVSAIQKRGRLRLSTAESRKYASQLRLAAKDPVNFSGHYVFATWGCGSGCVMGGAIDANTGRVTMLPFTISDWPLEVTEPISFRSNSCLLIVQGSRNEQGHGTYYYRFSGKAFSLDKAVEK